MRTLFELHSGRHDHQIPSNLLLGEIKTVQGSDGKMQVTTSEDLIAALGPMGFEYVNHSGMKGKVDLSYVKSPMLLILNRREAIEEARKAKEDEEIARKKKAHLINLKYLLCQYLREVDPILKYQARSNDLTSTNPRLDDALLKLLKERNRVFLDKQERDITDLMDWSWILTCKTTERAARRLLAIVAHRGLRKSNRSWSVPQFVFTFLLRRQNPNAEALRCLLIYTWDLMEKSERLLEPLPPLENLAGEALQGEKSSHTRIVKSREDDPLGMREQIFMIIVIRLLRSARMVWPAAFDNIVALINRYLDGLNFREGASKTTTLTSEDTARLAYKYNTLLQLVSLPASIGVFHSAFHQQRAQFSLLRRMNQFEPPLIVDRRGYRAVISMQLRHKKTLKEREWAKLKARSWPPWKEDKLGIDADISVEHGVSRAMEALMRSCEAGYGPGNWDAAASVLSGWDTDGSPTIQTRVVHLPRENRHQTSELWASRIRATRTLDEAWSCFLSFKNQKFTPETTFYVYHQMFEKILKDAKRPPAENADSTSTNYDDEQQPLPGDGTEVLAAPESPREAIYVHKPPPTINEFVELMAKDKVRPSMRFISRMLMHAPTLKTGLRYLEASTMSNEQIWVLIDEKAPSTPKAQAVLESIPIFVFSSFIRMLTRFWPRMPDKYGPRKRALVQKIFVLDSIMEETKSAQFNVLHGTDSELSLELGPSPRPIIINPLLKSVQLLLARKPRYRPAWYNVLRALSHPRVMIDTPSRFLGQAYQDIKAWQMIRHLLDEMLEIDLTLDLDGFLILCVGLEKAIFASETLSRNPRTQRGSNDSIDDMRSYVDHVLSTGVPLLKEIFKNVVRSKSMQQEIPASLKEERANIDKSVEEQVATESDDIEEDIEEESTTELTVFLPPGCLLPRLLEVPHPSCLHAFIRVLGLRQDYYGLLDLVEWMALFADEIHAISDQSANGNRMMRRCLTAVRVFMERRWTVPEKREAEAHGEDPSNVRDELEMRAKPAPAAIVRAIQEIVKENKRWGGWPNQQEVVQYCVDGDLEVPIE